MKEFKGTKGEWSISKNEFGQFEVESEHSLICEPNGLTYKTQRANSKLIAAAPDLLEALQVCYKSLCTYGNHPIIEKQVEQAINKALGE